MLKKQLIILSQNSRTPSFQIGFNVLEEIIGKMLILPLETTLRDSITSQAPGCRQTEDYSNSDQEEERRNNLQLCSTC